MSALATLVETAAWQSIDAYRKRIPRDPARGMLTDVVVFATDALLDQVRGDLSLEQAMNVAALPGIVGPSLVMPDIHQGYGFPIGGVAATDWESGVVAPGGIGFDINCGVRLIRTNLSVDDVRPRMKEILNHVSRDIPCGTGGESAPAHITWPRLDDLFQRGAQAAVDQGHGEPRDIEFCEDRGMMDGADLGKLSDYAKQRGRQQIGTLGSGNHFLEFQYVEEVHDPLAAGPMGLEPGQVVISIHCGGRGLAHQVCTDFLAQAVPAMKRYYIEMPDRQLACVPIQSPEGQAYLGAMRAAANFAWANRQYMHHSLRMAFQRAFGPDTRLDLVYDVGHNIAKRERHQVDGRVRDLLVHRKGASRGFAPGHPDLPAAYRHIGQPVFVPGSMGTASWVMSGGDAAMEETFGSVCHGAGRLMSRTAAHKLHNVREVQRKLDQMGIVVRCETRDGILEEVPQAYKNVDEVIDVLHNAGLAYKVARLRPLGVIKG
jgi:tRNA-splicing ligase RtcB